jgi:hypothetical protein
MNLSLTYGDRILILPGPCGRTLNPRRRRPSAAAGSRVPASRQRARSHSRRPACPPEFALVSRQHGRCLIRGREAVAASVLIRVEDEPPAKRLDSLRHALASTMAPFDVRVNAAGGHAAGVEPLCDHSGCSLAGQVPVGRERGGGMDGRRCHESCCGPARCVTTTCTTINRTCMTSRPRSLSGTFTVS